METEYSFTAGAEELLKRANFPKEAVPAPVDGTARWDKASLTQFLASQGITVTDAAIEQEQPQVASTPAPAPEAQIMGIGDAASAEVIRAAESEPTPQMDDMFADGAINPGAMPPPPFGTVTDTLDPELRAGNINEFSDLSFDGPSSNKPGCAAQPSYAGPTNDELKKILADTAAHYGHHPVDTVLSFGWHQRAIAVQLMNDGDWVITGSVYDKTTLSKTLTVQKVK